ncbi:MAG: hypothetical protein J7513_12425 [Solirubrobacteraceae bacterium]|nr:hypothetical protein [Solirubrobacteraceae bacterium]
MLDDAVAAFLDSVTIERDFDEPFMALLRAEGFTDIALIHGVYEMGKDIVARRDGKQWLFQTKAGDVNGRTFGEIRNQLTTAQISDIAAPSFDKSAERVVVLVTTGRLTGGAAPAAQEFRDYSEKRGDPEVDFWPRDELVGKFVGNADAALRTSVDGQLLGLLGAIDDEVADMDAIEAFSRRWLSWEPIRMAGVGIIEAAIVAQRLRRAKRLDLAAHVGLCAVRAGWVSGEASAASRAGAALFETYAKLLWSECDDRLLREQGIVGYSGFSAWVTYQVRCLRIAEIVALLALRAQASEPDLAANITDWLVKFFDAQPGLCRPLSDRYAVSLIPLVLVLADTHPDKAQAALRSTAGWVCTRYEASNLGLADAEATPAEELTRILGAPFQHVRLQRRPSSQAAAVLLDLAALLGFAEVYADIRNDTLAVGLYPTVLLPGKGSDWLLRTGLGNRWDVNAAYADEIVAGQPAAPHLAATDDGPVPADYWWDALAVSAATRDRHFPDAICHARSSGNAS